MGKGIKARKQAMTRMGAVGIWKVGRILKAILCPVTSDSVRLGDIRITPGMLVKNAGC